MDNDISAAEHRSIAGYVQMLTERDLGARDDAERVIHVCNAQELHDTPGGTLVREDNESDERYRRRAEALRILLGGGCPSRHRRLTKARS